MIRRVRNPVPRQPVEQRRPVRKIPDSAPDDDAPGSQRLAILERQAEPVGLTLDKTDLSAVQVRRHSTLEPAAVPDEVVQRDRLGNADPEFPFEIIQRQSPADGAMCDACQEDRKYMPFGMRFPEPMAL
jgi:hypothetical protein